METLLKTNAGAPGENIVISDHQIYQSPPVDPETEFVEKLSLQRSTNVSPAENPNMVQLGLGRVFFSQYAMDSLDDLDEDDDDDDVDDLDEIDLDEEEIVTTDDDDLTDDDIDDELDPDEEDEDDDDLI